MHIVITHRHNWPISARHTCVVYEIRHPRSRRVVYVGKASADRQRVNAHRGKSCEHNSLLQKWKVAIRRQGLTPEVVEVAFFKYDRLAIRVEKELIDFYGRMYGKALLNRHHHPLYAQRKVHGKSLPFVFIGKPNDRRHNASFSFSEGKARWIQENEED